jgi:hypothetical protein
MAQRVPAWTCSATRRRAASTPCSGEPFYTEQVNGQRFVDWMTGLIDGEPVADVHSQTCRAG